MKAAFLILAGVSTGVYAHAQSSSAIDPATDRAQIATPVNTEHADPAKGISYDDGQTRPSSDYSLPPGGGRGGGGGGGAHPGGGGGGRPGGGGGRPEPGGPNHGGRPGGGFHPTPGGPSHGGRPVPPGQGSHPGGGHGNWGPGNHGGYGRGWHPGNGAYRHNPSWRPDWRWQRDFHPRWWYAGVAFPLFFWDIGAPSAYWQCIAFDEGGAGAEPYIGYGPVQDEAAFNAIEACGGESSCYIPPGYCQLR